MLFIAAQKKTNKNKMLDVSFSLSMGFLGATVENSLDGIEATPAQYAQSSKKVPDINFFYRCLFEICSINGPALCADCSKRAVKVPGSHVLMSGRPEHSGDASLQPREEH